MSNVVSLGVIHICFFVTLHVAYVILLRCWCFLCCFEFFFVFFLSLFLVLSYLSSKLQKKNIYHALHDYSQSANPSIMNRTNPPISSTPWISSQQQPEPARLQWRHLLPVRWRRDLEASRRSEASVGERPRNSWRELITATTKVFLWRWMDELRNTTETNIAEVQKVIVIHELTSPVTDHITLIRPRPQIQPRLYAVIRRWMLCAVVFWAHVCFCVCKINVLSLFLSRVLLWVRWCRSIKPITSGYLLSVVSLVLVIIILYFYMNYV